MADKTQAHYVDCDINPDTLEWTCTPLNAADKNYPLLNALTAAEIPTQPTIPADSVGAAPTQITNRAGLEAIADATDYILMNDIDLTVGGDWVPLSKLGGILDGNGKTISNMTINSAGSNDLGLFEWISDGSVVQNLTFSNCTIVGDDQLGILAGSFSVDAGGDTELDIVIKNVNCTGCSITGESYVGGLIGAINTSRGNVIIANSSYSGTITTWSDSDMGSGDEAIGGLVGYWFVNEDEDVALAEDYMINCTSTGTITATYCSKIGGLIGDAAGFINDDPTSPRDQPGYLYVHGCSSSMNIVLIDKKPGDGVGGAFGNVDAVNITSCYATGNITNSTGQSPTSLLGGFIGEVVKAAVVTNCYCTGNIVSQLGAGGAEFESAVDIGGFVGGALGGIAGYYTHFLRCYTTSDITISVSDAPDGKVFRIGGFAGSFGGYADGNEAWTYAQRKSFTGFFERCWSEGDIYIEDLSWCHISATGSSGIGAFIGQTGFSGHITENCYSWTAFSESPTASHGGEGVVLGGYLGISRKKNATGTGTTATNYYHASPGETNGLPTTGGASVVEGIVAKEDDVAVGIWVDSCFWDADTDNVAEDGSNGNATILPTATDGATGEDTATMQTITTYSDVGWDISEVSGTTDDSIWYMPPNTARPIQDRALWYPADWTHLEGEEVQVLGDGAYLGVDTVASGEITLDDNTTTNHVGLAYTSKLIPMKVDSIIYLKRIAKTYLQFYNTLGGKYGETLLTLYPIIFRSQTDDFGDSADLYSGYKELGFEGSYTRHGNIWVTQDIPLPMTLLGIVLNLTMDDGSG